MVLAPKRGVSSLVRRVYHRAGALLVLAVVAVALGVVLQASVDTLPWRYTWLTPFRAARDTMRVRWFPSWVLLAWFIGFLAAHRGAARAVASQWTQVPRVWRLARLLALLAGLGADVLLYPAHHPLDALALGVLCTLVVAPTPQRRVVQLAVSSLVGVLLFSTTSYWFTVVKALTFVGREPLDPLLIRFETWGEFTPHRWVAGWASTRPAWVEWFDWAYFRMLQHMLLTLVVLLAWRDPARRARYVAANAICYLLGGPLYLLFPALGPVYFEPELYGYLNQPRLLTPIIQQELLINTTVMGQGDATFLPTWNFIACMPSLHLAHELVMTIAVRPVRVAFACSLAFMLLTTVTVVALGWHYPTDIIAGLALGALAWALAGKLPGSLLPQIDRPLSGGPPGPTC